MSSLMSMTNLNSYLSPFTLSNSFNMQSGYPGEPSLVGTLVFPGRQSVLPASTVPEYAAQAYPLLNYSSSAQQMVSALGDDKLGFPNFANFNSQYTNSSYSYSNPYSNNSYINNNFRNNSYSNNSIINIILNFINIQNPKSAETNVIETKAPEVAEPAPTTTTNVVNGLSLFDPKPLSDPFGNQIPFNYAATQFGLFGNFYGTQSIVSRYVADVMPTDQDAPGYTWKYTVPGQYSIPAPAGTNTTSTTTTTTSTVPTSTNNGLSLFDPKPLSDPFGNQIPYNNAAIQYGLFGNVHGVTSILSRYVADVMPTDKDAPGYTWKYTVPEG